MAYGSRQNKQETVANGRKRWCAHPKRWQEKIATTTPPLDQQGSSSKKTNDKEECGAWNFWTDTGRMALESAGIDRQTS